MPDYKPNSHRYKEGRSEALPEKHIKKVVTGNVQTRKKSGLNKLGDVFISDDAKNVKEYFVTDMAVPFIKKSIITIIDMILNGGTPTYTNGHSNKPKVRYGKFYDDDRRPSGTNVRPRFDFDDIEYEHRGEAEAVLDAMCDALDTYKIVTVADMYDMAGLSQPYTSNKFGWTNLRDARVIRSGGKYIIDLPKALPID